MSKRASVLVICLALLVLRSADAKMYKCVNSNGETTYSQTACSGSASQEKISEIHKPTGDVELCKNVYEFSLETAKLMKKGMPSAKIINKMGGLYEMNKLLLAVIDYVYFYQFNDDITSEQISTLAETKCLNGAWN